MKATFFLLFVVVAVSLAFKYPSEAKLFPIEETPVEHKTKERPKIDEGTPADVGQLPWQVFLEVFGYGPEGFFIKLCGGALITNQTIITSGNCTRFFGGFAAIMGRVTLSSLEEGGEAITLPNYHDFSVHENFSFFNLHNDIGLIRFPHPIAFNDQMQAISLPEPEDVANIVGENVTVAGWGRSVDDFGDYLLYGENTVITNAECESLLGSAITDTKICFHGVHSPCKADSGAPVTYKTSDGRHVLVGISSIGTCPDLGIPSAATRVSEYVDWIREHAI